jgi:carboxyl-terminal processing protease
MDGQTNTGAFQSDPKADERNRLGPGCARVAGALSLAAVLLGLGGFGGILFDRLWLTRFVPLSNIPSSATRDFRLMAQAWSTIDRYYVDRTALKPRRMAYGAISGMVYALGDTGHSTFLSPRMVQVAANVEAGKLQGIGIEVSVKSGHIEVVAPLDNSPAQRAGLRSGDVILDVDGRDVSGKPLSEVIGWITGPPDSRVTLRVLNPNLSRTRVVTLKRASITVPGLTAQRLPGTQLVQIRIAQFSAGVTRELEHRLKSLDAEPARGLILDLRDDPGGLLDEAVGVASQFLAKGNVLLEKDAEGAITSVPVQPGGAAPTVPLVVLINHGTGSAAEIVAAALKDAGRARLVGEVTFGTGTVLAEFPLSDGSAVLLAVEEWLTPKGDVIWHKGVEPNVEVTLAPDATPVWPEAERTLDAKQLEHSDDRQLLDAIELLTPKSGPRLPASVP